ncbi:MAG: PAS domain S-box protein [Rhodomicrobium sp.]
MSRSPTPSKHAFPYPIEKIRALLAGWRLKSEIPPVSSPDEIQEQFAKIAASALDAIIAVNSRQQIILFNPAAEAMFGLPALHALGQPVNILIPDRFHEPHAEHLDRYMVRRATARSMGALGKLFGLRANGEEFPIEASISGTASKGGGIYVVIIRDVTERVRLEEQLRSFIDHAPAAIAMFDREMRYLAASRRWRKYYALPADIAGRSHDDEFPANCEPWREARYRTLAGETVASAGECIERPGASRAWLEWEMRPWYSSKGTIEGVILLTEDITGRKEAENALRESEARFRSVYQHAAIGIATAGLEGKFAGCNGACASMLGYSEDELRRLALRDLIHPEDREASLDGIERLVRGEIPLFETVCRCLRKNGDVLWAEKTVSRLDDADGKPSNILMLLADRTERHRAAERQRLLMRELAHRGKNLLAVVQSIASRSLLDASSLDDARNAFNGRLQALARIYGSLTDEAFEGARLDGIIAAELQLFSDRSTIQGPKIMLSAKVAQTFALVVHELATNAVKYGAFSVPGGTVDVAWNTEGAADGGHLEFVWAEKGGSPVLPPSRRGFGTTLISSVAGDEFGCTPELIYGREGFCYRFSAPLGPMGAVIEEAPVRRKLKSEALTAVYDAWDGARNPASGLADFAHFDRGRFAAAGELCVVEIGPDGGVGHIEASGRTIAQLDRALKEAEPGLAEADGLVQAYRRCAATAEPCYESLRFDFGKGDAANFEKLLLPYSANGMRVTHIVGIAMFHGENSEV